LDRVEKHLKSIFIIDLSWIDRLRVPPPYSLKKLTGGKSKIVTTA
jgi:hypothetical protein